MTEPAPSTTLNHAADREWMGGFAAFKRGFQAAAKNPQFVGIYIVVEVLAITILNYNPHNFLNVAVGILLPLLVTVPFTKFALAAADNKVESLPQLFKTSGQEFGRVILAILLTFGLLIAGVVLILIPWIWFIPWTTFMLFVIIQDGVGVKRGFQTSRQLARNNKSKVWGLVGVAVLYEIVVAILGHLPIVGPLLSSILASVLGLVAGVASALLYKRLQAVAGEDARKAA